MLDVYVKYLNIHHMENTFTFEGAVVVNKPFIPFEAFTGLEVGTVLKGRVDSISTFKDTISAEVEINGHITKVLLYNYTLNEAKALIGETVKVKLSGFNEKDGIKYPKLYLKY